MVDMGHVVKLYKQSVKITLHGVLGSDILLEYGAVLDYRDFTLKLSKKNNSIIVNRHAELVSGSKDRDAETSSA